jgi:hypothetical protein
MAHYETLTLIAVAIPFVFGGVVGGLMALVSYYMEK